MAGTILYITVASPVPRDNDGPIELWAGVSTDDYPLLTVTLQQEAQTESSGQVVLKALVIAP